MAGGGLFKQRKWPSPGTAYADFCRSQLPNMGNLSSSDSSAPAIWGMYVCWGAWNMSKKSSVQACPGMFLWLYVGSRRFLSHWFDQICLCGTCSLKGWSHGLSTIYNVRSSCVALFVPCRWDDILQLILASCPETTGIYGTCGAKVSQLPLAGPTQADAERGWSGVSGLWVWEWWKLNPFPRGGPGEDIVDSQGRMSKF